jgi:hypothetical protein
MNPLSSRNAQIQMGIKPIIGIVLAVIVILATVVVFVALVGVFVGDVDQETEALYNEFLKAADTLANENVPDGTACYIRASMGEDWMLFMFDVDKGLVKQTCGGDEDVKKPEAMSGKAAFCVCDVGDSGGDDDDCMEEGAKCRRIDYFKKFWYPDHNEYDDDEFGWWSDDVDSWKANQGIKWGDGHIYGQDCDGSVWSEGPNTYIIKKDGPNLVVKRLPKSTDDEEAPKTTTGRLKSNNAPLKPCRKIAQELEQTTGGGVASTIKQ